MLAVHQSSRFSKGLKRAIKRGKSIEKLHAIVRALQQRKPLAEKHRDHWLKGNFSGYRECHIEPDWLLVYRVKGDALELLDTGTHSDLFT